jgi:hypothetical protein
MLTKEERAAIAERLKNVDELNDMTFYKAITGRHRPDKTSYTFDLATMSRIIFDLCDTSNMVELPRDKDGEVIRVGDTVYIGDGIKYEVTGYMMRGNSTEVILAAGAEPVYTKEPANNITHKKPVTIASINEQLRHVLDKGHMSSWSMAKLFDIADQLESLSDKDE